MQNLTRAEFDKLKSLQGFEAEHDNIRCAAQGRRTTMEDYDISLNDLPRNVSANIFASASIKALRRLHRECLDKFPNDLEGGLRPGSCVSGVIITDDLKATCVDVGDSRVAALIISKDGKVTPHFLNTVHSSGDITTRTEILAREPNAKIYTVINGRNNARINLQTILKFVESLKETESDESIKSNFVKNDDKTYWLSNNYLEKLAAEYHKKGIVISCSQRIGCIGTPRSICSSVHHLGASSEAEVKTTDLNTLLKEGERTIIASFCDGFFEGSNLSLELYAQLLEFCIADGIEDLAPLLMTKLAYTRGSGDNLTVRFLKTICSNWVFDGHGDARVSKFLSENIRQYLMEAILDLYAAKIEQQQNTITHQNAELAEKDSVIEKQASLLHAIQTCATSGINAATSSTSHQPDRPLKRRNAMLNIAEHTATVVLNTHDTGRTSHDVF